MKKDLKSADVSMRNHIEEAGNALTKNLANTRRLKRKLEDQENVIHDLSSTHKTCREILGEFHKLKKWCVRDRL